MRFSKFVSLLGIVTIGLFLAYLPKSWTDLVKYRTMRFLFTTPSFTRELDFEDSSALKEENRILREKCAVFQAEINKQRWLDGELLRIREIEGREMASDEWRLFFERRLQELKEKMRLQTAGIVARVIIRDPSLWSAFLWIDVGTADNEKWGKNIVEKNSVVLLGNKLIGLVEEVGRNRSSVRLLTDSQLTVAVRAIRGESTERCLFDLTHQLLDILKAKQATHGLQREEENMVGALKNLLSLRSMQWGDHYLAKGELCGSSMPLWRSKKPVLKGCGFNYDFADSEGPSRDLRSGDAVSSSSRTSIPLLQIGDLLITSGLDGVFPPGLEVGIVTQIARLREGATSYEVEAIPAMPHLAELSFVWVIPSCEIKN